MRASSACPASRPRRIWLYDQADFEEINSVLSGLDWSEVSTASDINKAWAVWKNLFMSVIDREVPSKIANPKSRVQQPWITAKLKDLIKQKHSAWRAFKRFPSALHQSAFRSIRNKVCSALWSAEKQCLLPLHRDIRLLNSRLSVKRFWKYIKQVTGRIKGSTIPDLTVTGEDGSQSTVSSDFTKATALNSFFAQQTHQVDCPSTFPDLPTPSQVSPDSFSTTPAEVFDTLRSLKPGKAPGPDGIPLVFYNCVPGGSLSAWLPSLIGVFLRVQFRQLGRRPW